MPLTIPFTSGFQEVIVYGLDALKLNTLLRGKVVPACEIAVNVPTAYMVLPHCAICRTCSVVPVLASCGVLYAGVVPGGPVAAEAGTAVQAAQAASHGHPGRYLGAPVTTTTFNAPRPDPHQCMSSK